MINKINTFRRINRTGKRVLCLMTVGVLCTALVACDETEYDAEYDWEGAFYVWPEQGTRGRFTVELKRSGNELTGTIDIPALNIAQQEVTGNVVLREGHPSVQDFEFSDIDQKVTFRFTSLNGDPDETSDVTGEFNTAEKMNGFWHTSNDPDIQTFASITDYQISVAEPDGIAFDGTHLWLTEDKGDASLYVLDMTGQQLDTTMLPGLRSGDLTYDGKRLLMLGQETSEGYQVVDTDTGSVVAQLDSLYFTGLTYAEDNVFTTEISGQVHQWPLDSTQQGTVLTELDGLLTAIAFDGTHLWVAREALEDVSWGNIIKLDMSGQVAATYYSPAKEPTDLAFDGTHLWVVEHGVNVTGGRAMRIAIE